MFFLSNNHLGQVWLYFHAIREIKKHVQLINQSTCIIDAKITFLV